MADFKTIEKWFRSITVGYEGLFEEMLQHIPGELEQRLAEAGHEGFKVEMIGTRLHVAKVMHDVHGERGNATRTAPGYDLKSGFLRGGSKRVIPFGGGVYRNVYSYSSGWWYPAREVPYDVTGEREKLEASVQEQIPEVINDFLASRMTI